MYGLSNRTSAWRALRSHVIPFTSASRLNSTKPPRSAWQQALTPSSPVLVQENFPKHFIFALDIGRRFLKYSIFGLTILAVSAGGAYEAAHMFVEKNGLAPESDEEVKRWQWESDADKWTGDSVNGGTDPNLGFKVRHLVRAAWMAYTWGIGYTTAAIGSSDQRGSGLVGPMGIKVINPRLQLTEDFLREAIRVAESSQDGRHSHTLAHLWTLHASILEKLGDDFLPEAKAELERAAASLDGDKRLNSARLALKLGDIDARLGLKEQALERWTRTLALLNDKQPEVASIAGELVPERPPSSPLAQRLLSSTLVSLSAFYARTGQYREAQLVEERALSVLRAIHPPDSLATASPPQALHALFLLQRSSVISVHLAEVAFAQRRPAVFSMQWLTSAAESSERVARVLTGLPLVKSQDFHSKSDLPHPLEERLLTSYSSSRSMKGVAEGLLRDARRTAAESWNLMGALHEKKEGARSRSALACYERAVEWAGCPSSDGDNGREAAQGIPDADWKMVWSNYQRMKLQVEGRCSYRGVVLNLSFIDTRFLADRSTPLCSLEVAKSFALLSSNEKKYTHYLNQASWAGARIIQGQWTPHAIELYDLLILIFSSSDKFKLADLEALRVASKVNTEDWENLLQYTIQVLSNLVNFKSFGFTKIIPRVNSEIFEAVVLNSANKEQAASLWNKLKDHIYSTTPEASLYIGKRSLGHVSNYYVGEVINDEEVTAIQAAAEKLNIDVLNTRVAKKGPGDYVLLIASANTGPSATHEIDVQGKTAQLRVEYAAHNTRFETGSIQDHKDASKEWVKDVGPVVESYIGFIETYVDPYGGRAEWEGFTAIVNKELSAKYEILVNKAPELIKVLPWGKNFEVDIFRKPDFTALEVVNFATGGIPAGINIPNYYDIRASTGFKNVSLANILAAKSPNEKLTFIHPDDVDLYNSWDNRSFELQVANHELLGHGSGKLFEEYADGTKNFVPEQVINPLTGKPITSWYKPGQTPGSVLGEVSSSMEECRAETVALYLVGERDILEIFGYTDSQDIENIQYITFLLMARAGLRGLEFYDPVNKKHGQAHMQARLGITQHLIRSGIARLEEVRDANGALVDLYVRVDKNLVLTKGREVAGKLLIELQVRKSTADGAGAREYYNNLTNPIAGWEGEIRDLVLAKKQPRKVFVQPNTHLVNGNVELKEYAFTPAGVIESFIERNL
ncbi:hypothetical protein AGABI2DRAFT_64000 [Agaricus bisporus var. bisporus H97]|uniref:hypothetical protein n=1 Tax=Agaricus bisporus var. bisporus (strain H97 / ATCC MYA-4626 / FGSC 10389) TaxID=936046 RepID=UPI00029F79D1|nr:hypothetical protein AGABI2DRAFT_64000 [Agaricus bisporus var. bisporus H97]EKV50088.1 hypothetical protein AGABI2DRAFT_64000 [Agaricus bisporus var. bisporus H97]